MSRTLSIQPISDAVTPCITTEAYAVLSNVTANIHNLRSLVSNSMKMVRYEPKHVGRIAT
jgi:hypothetical protein